MPSYNHPGSPNLGIVFDKEGAPAPGAVYVDAEFNERPVETLTTSYSAMAIISGIPDTPRPYVSRTRGLTLFVEIGGSDIGETVTIKLEARKDETRPWNLLQTVRQDTGAVAAEHDILFAESPLIIQTASEFTTGQIQVSVKSTKATEFSIPSPVIVRAEAA